MMTIRLFLLIALVAGVCLFTLISFFRWIETRGSKKVARKALEKANAQDKQIWTESQQIEDLLTGYVRMVVKHGPGSEEAKLFRFNVSSKKLLGHNQECLAVFEKLAGIVEQEYKDK